MVGEELNEDDGEEVEEVEEEEEVEDAAEELEGLLLKELEVSPRIPLSTCVRRRFRMSIEASGNLIKNSLTLTRPPSVEVLEALVEPEARAKSEAAGAGV